MITSRIHSRRTLLRRAGAGALVLTGSLLAACGAPPPAPTAAPAAPTTAPVAAPTTAPVAAPTAPPAPTTAPAAPPTAPAATAPTPTTAAAAQPAATKPAAAIQTITVWLGDLQPTEWTSRSAEKPVVVNASRILGQRFETENPGVKVSLPVLSWTDQDAREAWLAARVSSGDAPEVWNTFHPEAIRKGWTVALETYLQQPNPYAPKYKAWADAYYPALLKSLTWAGDHIYAVALDCPFPQTEIGLMLNLDLMGDLKPPRTWSEEKAVAKKLKETGTGLCPWPAQQGFDCWPFALQILPAMLQDLGPELDTDKSNNVNVDEALVAFRKGMIGPLTPRYQTAWREYRELTNSYVDGWTTADLELVWRKGKGGMRYASTGQSVALRNDPSIPFKNTFITQPYITAADIPGAKDPDRVTAGDGKMPGDLMVQIVGGGISLLKSPTDAHRTLEPSLKFLQFISAPEQVEYLINENEFRPPAAIDAKLGPIWGRVANQPMPLRKYTFTWPGMGIWFDINQHIQMRRFFQAWITNQLDDKAFFDRLHQDAVEAADRYEAQKKKLEEKKP